MRLASAAANRAFLQACAVGAPGDWNGREDLLRSLAPREWETLAALAQEHGFTGLLARNLAWAEGRTGLRPAILEPLAARRRSQLVQHLSRKAAARRVGVALQGRDIPFIAFKGIALAEEVYGDLSLREFRDFDVMVPRERAHEAHGLLVELGYGLTQGRQIHEYLASVHAAGMEHPDGSGVDLHWSIAPDVREPRKVAVVWANCRPAGPVAFLPGLRLSPEMTLLHLAKHFHSHQYGSVKPLVDFYVAARHLGNAIDARRLESVAAELELLPVLDVAAGVCARCFQPASMPGILMERATRRHGRIARRMVSDDLMLNSARRSRIANWTVFLLAAGGARFAIDSLATILLPGRLLLAQFFGRPFEPGMYPRYYWRQLVKVVTLSRK